MTEVWKPVVGYEGLYEVSNIGRVKSLSRLIPYRGGPSLAMRKEKIMVLSSDKDGYKIVRLTIGKIQKTHKVHRLVANAFIPNANIAPQVNHKNGVRSDNRVDNLEWVTAQCNIEHKFRVLGYTQKNVRVGKSIKNLSTGATFPSIKAAARSIGVRPCSIRYAAMNSGIYRGEKWAFAEVST